MVRSFNDFAALPVTIHDLNPQKVFGKEFKQWLRARTPSRERER